MNIKRVTSALLGFPLVLIVLLIQNKYIVDIALTIIAYISMSEYFNAVSKVSKPVRWVGYLCCTSIAFVHIIPETWLQIIVTLSVPTILLLLFAQIIATDMKTDLKDVAYTLLGICYVVFLTMFVAFVDGMPKGNLLIWYVLFAAWGTDIFAFFVGKLIGKHKFSKVSPKKSIEGCIGGIIGAVALILIYTYVINTFWNMNYSYLIMTIVAIGLSIIGQLGDFAASSIKRHVDIKDYSNLIPGHGGMLDRIDSLLFIAPFAYAIFRMLN